MENQDVTQGAGQSPVDQIVAASTSDAPIEREHAEAPKETESVEQSTQPTPEYNWKQMREQVRQLNSQIKALEGASNLERWMKSNPENMQMIRDMMEGRAPQKPEVSQPKEDLYKDYDPVVAEKFRKLDAFEQWKAEQDKRLEQQKLSEQDREQATISKNMDDLDSSFEELLIKDGFMREDGSGDQDLFELISDAMLTRLAKKFGDPRRATRDQVQEVYKAVTNGLSAHQKFTLKKTVKTDVPLSGSRKGSIPMGKTKLTEDERIASIANSLG